MMIKNVIDKTVLKHLDKINELSRIEIFSDGSGKIRDYDDDYVLAFTTIEECVQFLKSYKNGKSPSHYMKDKKHGSK